MQQNGGGDPGLLILLALAVWGAIADFNYRRRGGLKSTKTELICLLVAVVLCAGTLIALGYAGASPEALGRTTPILAVMIFLLWEAGRWRVRRKNRLPVFPTAKRL